MKFTAAQLLLAGAVSGLPHMDSPRQRLLNGLELPDKFEMKDTPGKGKPYTPEHRDPYDGAIDPYKEDLDPKPWRNGLGASVLGPWNKERSKENPDLVRPPSTDHGNVANMRWSFADSHIRIEVSCACSRGGGEENRVLIIHRRAAGPVRPQRASSAPA